MKSLSLLCFALLLVGCQTRPESQIAFEAVTSQKALIRWHHKGVSLVYDAVCARSSGQAVLVRIYKQSPVSLAEFELGPENHFEARGRMLGHGWAGPSADAPPVLESWAAFLAAYRDSASVRDISRQIQTGPLLVAYTKSGNSLRALSVSRAGTGEVISAVFN